MQDLEGREVYLFPDLKAFDNWNNKVKKLKMELPGIIFKVSDLIEEYANKQEKEKGLDIADFSIQFDWRKFMK